MPGLMAMRIVGFLRGGRALAPVIAGLVVLAVLYGGGAAPAGEAYGVSAAVLFPVLAWQVKLLLDVEPDVQRRLARVSVGPAREAAAGLAAAALIGTGGIVLAMALPWLIGGIRAPKAGSTEPTLLTGLLQGAWAHLLSLLAAVALGALASRAVTRGVAAGAAVLVTGSVLAIAFSLRGSVAPWLVPPLMATARALADRPQPGAVLLLTGHAVLWSAVALAGYAWLRRSRC